jgi:VanZ family protein
MQTKAPPKPAPPRPLLRWLPAVLCMAIIFALSSRTGGQLDTWLPWFQELFPALTSFNPVHYAAYFALAGAFAFGFGFARLNVWRGLAVILLCVAYGATDEWHQSFVPMRSPDVHDLLHDGIGATVAVLLLWLWRFARTRRGSRNYSRS